MMINRPLRIVIVIVVLAGIYKLRVDSANTKKAIALSNNVNTELTKVILEDMDEVLVNLKWDVMLRKVDSLFEDEVFQNVPSLFSLDIPVLVERATSSTQASFDKYISKLTTEQAGILSDKILIITNLSMNKLRETISSYTSDQDILDTFEKNMRVVAASINEKATELVQDNTTKRLERITYIFDQVLEWKSTTYERFLFHALRIKSEMNPGSQLDTWVQLETQTIVSENHIEDVVSTELMEQYIGRSDEFIQLMDEKYGPESSIYSDLGEFFSRRASTVQSVLVSQYSRVFTMRVNTIDGDSLLDDDQKRVLKLFARDTRKASEASNLVVSTSISELEPMYSKYAERLLKELRVVIIASFLEYESISLRSESEGRQTCIVQFYQLRRALNDAFFFEYSKDRLFDINKISTDFEAEFVDMLSSAGENMLSLARTGFIHYMYENARTFLLSRANLFFRDDTIVLNAIKPMMAKLHDDYATIIPLRLQSGIDQEMKEENELARLEVGATLDRFMGNMEYSVVTDLISGVRQSIIDDVLEKVEEIYEDFGKDLNTEFIKESLKPYDFAWFEEQSKPFVDGDEIRFIDMKEHIINQTNARAEIVLKNMREEKSALIDSLFSKVNGFMDSVVGDFRNIIDGTSLQDEDSIRLLNQTLDSTIESMGSFSETIKQSTLVKLEDGLGDAVLELEDVQGVRVRNFFNTKIQLIKDEFATIVTEKITDIYQSHLDDIEGKMNGLAVTARTVFREHVNELVELERNHRADVEEVAAPVMEEEAQRILADYNIVSFGARQSSVELGMKNIVNSAAREVATQRRISLLRFNRKWENARSDFRAQFMEVADESKSSFRRDIIDVTIFAKDLAVDIMGHVDVVIDALERDLFAALDTQYTSIIDSVIGTDDNDLPSEISLSDVVFSPGIMELSDTPVLPSAAFIKDSQPETEDSIRGEDGQVLPAVDEDTGLSTLDIVLALMPWDDWLKSKIDEIVAAVVFEMQDELKQNTCRNNKPPCREGWVQFTNSWDVECCRFDPVAQGFPYWQVTRMLAKEILLSLVLDLGTIIETSGKIAKKVGGSKAGKLAAKGLAKGQKAMAKSMQKLAGKSAKSMTKSIKLAGKFAGKAMKKTASTVGVKIASRVGTKLAAKGAAIGAKAFAKLGMGPLGIALMIFDVLSLVLDLWDPSGYNDSQTNGKLKGERDPIEKQYHEALVDEGFESPLLADPMFHMSPTEQAETYSNIVMDWFQDSVTDFMTRNEANFEVMPDSESTEVISAEYQRLATQLEEDPNLVVSLIAAKLDNVFLQDIDVRHNHVHPYAKDNKESNRVHTKKDNFTPSSGIMEIVLNKTGVAAFNRFHQNKVKFIDSLRWNPMYRFIKREHDYFRVLDIHHNRGEFAKTGTYTSAEAYELDKGNMFGNPIPTLEHSKQYALELNLRADVLESQNRKGSIFSGDSEIDNRAESAKLRAFAAEILSKVSKGWILVLVDPEEEFWIQYSPDKSLDELLDRSTYMATHDKILAEGRAEHELTVDSLISVHIDEITPADADIFKFDDLKIAHLSKTPSNWVTQNGKQCLKYPLGELVPEEQKVCYTLDKIPVVPTWLPSYSDLKSQFEAVIEEQHELDHNEEMAVVVATQIESIKAEKQRRKDIETQREQKLASLSRRARIKQLKTNGEKDQAEIDRKREAVMPEFAVFLNGYGQSSPLYNIYEGCLIAGKGVTYNERKGLCNFTESYCTRFGMDFFYNSELGTYDCEIGRGQQIAEFIFGTTITRSFKRGGQALGASQLKRATKKVGRSNKALGMRKIYQGVRVSDIQDGEAFNYLDSSASIKAIESLGLSGF